MKRVFFDFNFIGTIGHSFFIPLRKRMADAYWTNHFFTDPGFPAQIRVQQMRSAVSGQFKAMIQGPMGRQRVEKVVFNVPSTVTDLPELAAWELRDRKGGGPPPMMIFYGFNPFFGPSIPFGGCLFKKEVDKFF